MGMEELVAALKRWLGLLARPEEEWNLVVAEKPSLSEAVFPFSVMGLLLAILLGLFGILLRYGEKSTLIELAFHVLVEAGPVAAFAVASALAARRFDAVRSSMGAVAALYSSAGLWLGSCLNLVPVPALGWLWLALGMGYTSYLYVRAMDLVIGVPGHAKPKLAAAALGSALVLSILLRVARLVAFSAMDLY